MIIDITGIALMPGNLGKNCRGNGKHKIECCCDECDYLICCTDASYPESCKTCTDKNCPRKTKKKDITTKEICQGYFQNVEFDLDDSPNYIKQTKKCIKLYKKIFATLNEDQRKDLSDLDCEYCNLSMQCKKGGFEKGVEEGFKLAVKLIIEKLEDYLK